jgi:SPP1 gp7 family putative phage head morphogenesis protein
MATTIDRTLFDRLVRQQIAVGRYAENQAYDIIRLLNRADKELIDKITARGEDGTFTKARLDALLRETRSMVDKTYRDLFDVTKAEMDAFAPHAAEVAASTLASQLPVSWSPVAISDEQLISIVNKTPISIGPDKKLLLEEVFQSMAANKEESIRGAIRLGMVQGETIDQITRRLKGTRANQYKDGILEGSRKSMEAITRTIVQHTNNVAVQSTFEKNKKVLDGWIYVATLDSRTCSVCFSVSGKQYPLGEGPLPVRHVRCRCFQAPAIKSWKDLGIDLPEFGPAQRASKDGYVSADISFHDWLKGQDKKTQVELLGKTRAQMFAEGKIKLDKFTDSSGKLLTLEQLKAKQADNVFRGASANQYLLKDIGPLNPKKIGS